MKETGNNKVSILFNLTKEEKKALKQISKYENRSMNGWLRNRIAKEIKELKNDNNE